MRAHHQHAGEALAALLSQANAWSDERCRAIPSRPVVEFHGRVARVSGTLIAARAAQVSVGELCELIHDNGSMLAEVVGFGGDEALLSPLGPVDGISARSTVKPLGRPHEIDCGGHLLGRVLDGFGLPLDGRTLAPVARDACRRPVLSAATAATARTRITEPLPTGVRAIDALLTLGRGQRMGLFAGPGCGKTTLLAAIARGTDADVIVFGLVGERGRELREFLEKELDAALVRRSVIICSTSDRPAMERVRAAFTATTVAEGFCAGGQRVMLLIDSLTRFARAQREIGLAAGEPPARMGFPPSVYAMMPRLVERAGNTASGSITALYTVLEEGESAADPIADEARSLLDGHIVLSRKLASSGHYPAIDVLASLSRTMSNVVSPEHLASASRIRALLAKYRELELLITLGEYVPGRDADADEAVTRNPDLLRFLRQDTHIAAEWAGSLEALHDIANAGRAAA